MQKKVPIIEAPAFPKGFYKLDRETLAALRDNAPKMQDVFPASHDSLWQARWFFGTGKQPKRGKRRD